MAERRPTSTSNFGVGPAGEPRRVGLLRPLPGARAVQGRHGPAADVIGSASRSCAATPGPWTTCADGSVALVVTSPPYFAGKQYEEELGARRRPDARTSSTSSCSTTSSPSAPARSSRAGASRSTWPTSAASRTAACRPTSSASSRTTSACCCGARSSGRRARAPAAVRVGLVPQRRQPRPARHHRAGDRRQQGPLRPGPSRQGARRRGPAPQSTVTPTTSWR